MSKRFANLKEEVIQPAFNTLHREISKTATESRVKPPEISSSHLPQENESPPGFITFELSTVYYKTKYYIKGQISDYCNQFIKPYPLVSVNKL